MNQNIVKSDVHTFKDENWGEYQGERQLYLVNDSMNSLSNKNYKDEIFVLLSFYRGVSYLKWKSVKSVVV